MNFYEAKIHVEYFKSANGSHFRKAVSDARERKDLKYFPWILMNIHNEILKKWDKDTEKISEEPKKISCMGL